MLHETGVNDEDDTVNGDRGFGDVSRQNDFASAFGRRLEDFGLHFTREVGIDGTDNQLLDFVSQCSSRFCQGLLAGFDLFLSLIIQGQYKSTSGQEQTSTDGKEDKNVALGLRRVYLEDSRNSGVQVVRFGLWRVVDIDRELATRDCKSGSAINSETNTREAHQ